jgi:hypothetical protein
MQFDSGLWMSPLFIFSVCGGLGWDGGGGGSYAAKETALS